MRTTERPAVLTAVAMLTACASAPPAHRLPSEPPPGLRHEPGANFVSTRVHYGIPILQKSFFWDGNGEVDDAGIGVHVGRHVSDAVAFGLGTNLVSWWTPGRDVYSCELEGLLRVHPVRDWPLFVDGTAGFQLANDQIPPGGTVWNFTFGFGGGVELPVAAGTSVLTGVTYHHISNALGRDNERNPSQNEARLWIGMAWAF